VREHYVNGLNETNPTSQGRSIVVHSNRRKNSLRTKDNKVKNQQTNKEIETNQK
jgi:hypothetical protein